jgi:hypothetical protein
VTPNRRTTNTTGTPTETNGRLVPHDAEAERQLLGTAALKPDAARLLTEQLNPEDFYTIAHQHVAASSPTSTGPAHPSTTSPSATNYPAAASSTKPAAKPKSSPSHSAPSQPPPNGSASSNKPPPDDGSSPSPATSPQPPTTEPTPIRRWPGSPT